MKIPDELSLISLFECEPTLLDDGVPYFYNEVTYSYTNQMNERFIFSLSPSYHELKIQVYDTTKNELLSILDLKNITEVSILSDKKSESRIMVTSDFSIIKIDFKPRYRIFINQVLDV